jgi:hypothetical protein
MTGPLPPRASPPLAVAGEPSERFRPESLPRWAQEACDGLVDAGLFEAAQRPNHVLVNGGAGIKADYYLVGPVGSLGQRAASGLRTAM